MNTDFFAVVSSEISAEELSPLASEFRVFTLPPEATLAPSVRSHPDMILSAVGTRLILSSAYYSENRGLIDEIAELSGLTVTPSSHQRVAKYPGDVGFNAAVTSGFLICNTDAAAPEILTEAESSGLSIVHVKQGYAACSCIVADDVVVTSDAGIHQACERSGLRSALVQNTGIKLPGYDVGFIGGAGGFACGTLYFYGSISGMECEDAIRGIAEHYGYRIKSLSQGPLTDRGGIKFIKYKRCSYV